MKYDKEHIDKMTLKEKTDLILALALSEKDYKTATQILELILKLKEYK